MSHLRIARVTLIHIQGNIALRDPLLTCKSNTSRCYSLAQLHGLRPEVIQVARLTLKFTLAIEKLESKLGVMPSGHLH